MAGPSGAPSQTKFRSPGSRSVSESSNDDTDWVDITHADLPIKLDDPIWRNHPSLSLNTSVAVVNDRTDNRSISESLTLTLRPDSSEPPYNHPQHVRSRLSLGVWKNFSKVSLQSPQSLSHRFSKALRRNSTKGDTHSVLDDFPVPPSHLPTPVTPLSAGQPVSYVWPSKKTSANNCNTKALKHDAKQPAVSHPIKLTANPLKTLAKVFSFNSRHHTQTEVPVTSVVPQDPPTQREVIEILEPLPEAPDEETPIEVNSEAPLNPTNSISYEFVDPRQLCPEPSPLIGAELFNTTYTTSARSSFIPPSPSWLSRNVPQVVIPDSASQATPLGETAGPITPPSPAPLPIPPRIFISSCSSPTNTPPLSPLEVTDCWLKHLDTVAQSRYSRISNISNLSRKTSAASIHGLFSSTDDRSDSKNTILTPVLLLSSPSVEKTSSSSRSSGFGFASSEFLQTPSFETSSTNFGSPRGTLEATSHPSTSTQHVRSSDLINLLSVLCEQARITMEEHGGNDLWGKRTDVVDFGGEVDYSGMQWFKEPPPEKPQPPPQQQQQAYDPEPAVVKQNEHYGYALSAAANVLYGRWKQYGQLGVLGWCSEFGELIDSLKELGMQGNMFLETRRKALEACRDILKLKMDIKMQIVVMYLSAQIQRLRRFLDPDTMYDDYPEPAFPLDPYQGR
ncbi:hypothetical protein E1B28_000874 [Marasmius oreades]|uniref:Uncharacterized protein n=1 Tax=Marasmius oreades TaxID=181124 RepID=A0A9P7V2D6_9AGAR|nr:uncharacterized protein E1B28_000874 [Marasmius oreades]KAG7098988.1 hypothetical protein E1B28_000874 [Marasmius oreades]